MRESYKESYKCNDWILLKIFGPADDLNSKEVLLYNINNKNKQCHRLLKYVVNMFPVKCSLSIENSIHRQSLSFKMNFYI